MPTIIPPRIAHPVMAATDTVTVIQRRLCRYPCFGADGDIEAIGAMAAITVMGISVTTDITKLGIGQMARDIMSHSRHKQTLILYALLQRCSAQ